MKHIFYLLAFTVSLATTGQNTSDKEQIEAVLNYYIDGFYKGDTTALKKALKPRLYKFGYWKNKETNTHEYYAKMNFKDALAFVQKMKNEGRTRDENKIRYVEVLDISEHIAVAKVIAVWGIDYMTLSKDNSQWMIEQVIWEGPYLEEYSTNKTKTTYYLIRHAEKDRSDKANKDPHLTNIGHQRAKKWAETLSNIKFDAVYSTDYNRTKETATPVAKANGLDITLYDPNQINIGTFFNVTKGKCILIVGHSNTTPLFANNLLGEEKFKMIADDNNANLYIVTLHKNNKTSQLLRVN